MSYFVANMGGIGDWIMRTAIVRDMLIAYPEIKIYSSNKIVHGRNPKVEIVGQRRAMNKLGCNLLEIRYLPGVRAERNGTKFSTYYDMMRNYVERHMGCRIPETHPHATLQLSDAELERPSNVPSGKYWVLMPHSKEQYKSWGYGNFKRTVETLNGDVQFVSTGKRIDSDCNAGDTIDLRGKTTLSELFSIIHHSSGVLSSVGLGSHMAACVPTVDGLYDRPFVTIFGGREHPDRLPYPHMTGIHSIGELDCCADTDCFRRHPFKCPRGDQGYIKDCFNLIDPDFVSMKIKEIIGAKG